MTSVVPLYGSGKRGYSPDSKVVGMALVDEEDYADAMQFRWHLTDTGYAARWYGPKKARKRERLHRRVLKMESGDRRQVDHRNRDKLDNRKANLRVVSGDRENRQNVTGWGQSQHRGVTYDKRRGHWVAQAHFQGKRLYKRCATEEEAAAASAAWRREHMPFSTD